MTLTATECRVVSRALRALARDTAREIEFMRLARDTRPIRVVLTKDLATLESLAERIEA